MKKFLALFLALTLILTLVSCGGGLSDNRTPTDGDPTDESNVPDTPPQPSDSTGNDKENPTGPSYEVTYQSVKTWVNSIGTTWVQTIVEITNTGNTNLYLGSGAYDLEDDNGALVASQSLVSAYPCVLAPGEKGYMYEETTLDNFSGEGSLTVLPRPDVKEAKVDLIRYNVTDVSVSNDDFNGVKVLGRVENTTEESGSMVYIVAFFYDASGKPIGSAFTILTEELAAGAKIGFELNGFSLPDDVTADVISESVVYAYPYQMQF